MEPVLVEVRLEGETRGRDLELAPDLPAAELARLVAEALGWPLPAPSAPGAAPYDVEAIPPGRVLRPDETLAQAQAWDGATLIFRAAQAQTTTQARPGFAWTQLT